MPIDVVAHSSQFSGAVDAFNQRMCAGGSQWGFYIDPEPDWIPKREHAKSWREYHLAVENGETVRGGVAIKPQQWQIRGELHWVTDSQGPFTEADIDVKYSPLMLKLFRSMLKSHPLLISMGHGGTDAPIVDLLRKMNWGLHGLPFCFIVLKPHRFLRLNKYLRTTPTRRRLQDILAYSGLGFIGFRLLHGFIKAANRRARSGARAEVVAEFGDWADQIWQAHRDKYQCLAVRDSEMMNALLPQQGWPGGTRLKITRAGSVIGWSVVHDKQMTDDHRFGDLRVGLITDCFADPADAFAVISATHRYLASQGVDLIFANLSHPAWLEGMKANGYLVLENRRVFAVSPKLSEKLEPFEEIRHGLHLTNMDGHGPAGFQ